MDAIEEIVTDAETAAEEERLARLQERTEEQERQAEERRVEHERKLEEQRRVDERSIEGQEEQHAQSQYGSESEPDPAAARERLAEHLRRQEQERIEQERASRERTQAQFPSSDYPTFHLSDAGRGARRGSIPRGLCWIFLALLLMLSGAIVTLILTENPFEDIGIPGGGSEQPNTDDPDSVVPPVAPSPTATATATATPSPTPAPTAAPTPTPVPVSPWAGFAITSETLGRELLDRLATEELACVRSNVSEAIHDYIADLPLAVRISANPPVHVVSDMTELPELAECLSEESAEHLNFAIAVFHDPSLAPTPEPTVTSVPTPVTTATATPRPTFTATPIPTSTPTPRPTATPTPRPTATPDLTRGSAGWIQALEFRIHELVNRQRSTPLGFDAALASIARTHSVDMATSRFFSHTNQRGQSPTDRGAAVGYDCRKDYGSYYTYGLAENIFRATLYSQYWTLNGVVVRRDYYTLGELASLVVDGWMDSPGHRENILNNTFDVEGIGVAINDDEEVYVTQNFC